MIAIQYGFLEKYCIKGSCDIYFLYSHKYSKPLFLMFSIIFLIYCLLGIDNVKFSY